MTTAALGAEVLDRCLPAVPRTAGHPAGHELEVPAGAGADDRRPVAAGHRLGLSLSAHRRTAAAAIHSDDAPLRRCVDPARDAQRERATAADGGVPPAPPARGALRPRRPRADGVGLADGRRGGVGPTGPRQYGPRSGQVPADAGRAGDRQDERLSGKLGGLAFPVREWCWLPRRAGRHPPQPPADHANLDPRRA